MPWSSPPFAFAEEFGKIASDIKFMAGERVLRDAIVVPFSRGCNLLTVYSKKHIDSEPELKKDKVRWTRPGEKGCVRASLGLRRVAHATLFVGSGPLPSREGAG